jgi:hypothetical protein
MHPETVRDGAGTSETVRETVRETVEAERLAVRLPFSLAWSDGQLGRSRRSRKERRLFQE